MKTEKLILKEDEIEKFSEQIFNKIKNGGLIEFYGDLGTGKTTLTKSIAKLFNIPNFTVKSPTYTYIRSYEEFNFHHIDLYRLEKIDQLLYEEIVELIENPKNIVIIEWAEKLENCINIPKIQIHLKHKSKTERDIEIKHI